MPPLTFAWLGAGIIGAERLRWESTILENHPIRERLSELTEAWQPRRAIMVGICDRVVSPILVGIFRPVILLPPAALFSWTPQQLEMVLLHELAHIRRWDNGVNLVQRVIEATLFFHPAVWIVSAWVRYERELCCDEVVVQHTGQPHAYIELLVALTMNQPAHSKVDLGLLEHQTAASAMAQRNLVARIQYIVRKEDTSMLISRNLFALMFTTILALALGIGWYGPYAKAQNSRVRLQRSEPEEIAHATDSLRTVADQKEKARQGSEPLNTDTAVDDAAQPESLLSAGQIQLVGIVYAVNCQPKAWFVNRQSDERFTHIPGKHLNLRQGVYFIDQIHPKSVELVRRDSGQRLTLGFGQTVSQARPSGARLVGVINELKRRGAVVQTSNNGPIQIFEGTSFTHADRTYTLVDVIDNRVHLHDGERHFQVKIGDAIPVHANQPAVRAAEADYKAAVAAREEYLTGSFEIERNQL